MGDIEKLVNMLYERHRMVVEPSDPLFQAMALLIEYDEEYLKERQ